VATAAVVPLPLPAPEPRARVNIDTRPVYSVDELELYKSDCPEVARLFSAAEQVFGKLHHYNDLCVIFGIYDWLRLPLDVIELLLDHCAAGGRLNTRYIERVAIDWAERGIVDIETAKEHIAVCSEGYREIMKALGRGGRTPATKEREYIDKWLDILPLPVILEACDRTIMNTDKRVFAYCDKILSDWHSKGVADLDDINRVSADFTAQARKPAVPARKPTRFANFKQREHNFSEIERIERAYLELGRDKRVK
jgi:DnaD/phage-associated family protein